MKGKKYFLIAAVLYSLIVLGAVFYAVNIGPSTEIFLLTSILIFLAFTGIFTAWSLAAFHRNIELIASEMVTKYENIERLLIDIRDGTRYFYREKRRSFRIKTDILARFADGRQTGDDFLKIHDLSYDGALLKTTHQLKPGDTVKLAIYLPFFSEPITAKARIVRVRPTSETKGASAVYEAGIEFSDMSPIDNEKLIETVNILSKMSRKNISRR
ncbi:MAG: PilZ domain-containing protein [Candidatus Omnitrophica bacterium]|nr:PilZ domain-containing protein [Candidatus Omnitrophota bacterium]MCM8791326.1 PilZ domain-containing protein [Candidatus Omnitrophota bacterium]